ncbi:unnamed protein product [Clavelina lepadiformis]
MENLTEKVEKLILDERRLASNVDQFFLIVCGMFVLFMQAGFAFLEAGSVRSKNTTNIIMKNVLDVFIGAISYYAVGYAFAYGESGNPFIGHVHFFATNVKQGFNATLEPHVLTPDEFYATWFFQFVFAATASTIVSGAMAERTEFTTYMVYCIFLTGFVYPIVSHWGWSESGWLVNPPEVLQVQFRDFAGSAIVHITGGTAALIGAIFLGPRIGRFNRDGTINDIPGHSVTVAALGAFILFVGFLAFNGGSQLSISGEGDGATVALAIMNTVLGGSASAITTMLLYKVTDVIRGNDHYWSLIVTMNGALAGMVSMCASCNDLYPWAAVVIGVVAGCAFISWHYFIIAVRIDDPLDAVAVHLGGGLCGILLGPIFAINGLREGVGGIIYGGHYLAFQNFGWNLLGALAIMAWTGTISTILFGTMKLLGILRVSEEVEKRGLDKIKHGEPAYPVKGYHEAEGPAYLKERNGCHNCIEMENGQVSSSNGLEDPPPPEFEEKSSL